MPPARASLGLLTLSCAFLLASCDSRDNSALGVAVISAAVANETLSDTPDGVQSLVRAATDEGLVAFDAEGRVVPALADRWIITDDGQSYIFRLRDGNWRNGDELTAASARSALLSAFKAIQRSPLERDFAGIQDIRVMAGRVVEIRLDRPMPYFLQLLAQPEMGLTHEGQGTGPMIELAAQAPFEASAGQGDAPSAVQRPGLLQRLVPIEPSTLGMPAIEGWAARTRSVDLQVLPADAAVRAFNAGKVDLVLDGRIQDFLLTRSVGILRGSIQLDPVVGLFGLQVLSDKGFLSEPANREAIGMAIDRVALIDPFGVGGWQATTRIVTPGLDGDLSTIGERWGEQSTEERREVAATRVRAWMARQAESQKTSSTPPAKEAQASEEPLDNAPELKLWLPSGEGAQILFARLAADLAAVSIRLERTPDMSKADLVLIDDVARYPRASWFLNRLSCTAKQGLCSPEADARVDEAAKAATPEERAALLAEAEAELTAANVFIPFGTPIRWSLVRGSVNGFAANSWGWHPLMPLAWLPK